MGFLQVDTEVMAASAAKVATAIDDIDNVLVLLGKDVEDMLAGWTGNAADAHAKMHGRFGDDATRIRNSLMQMYEALSRTHATYVTQENQQTGDGRVSAVQISS